MSSRPSRVASSPASARSHKVAQSKAHIVHVAALTRRRAPRRTHSFVIDNSYGWLNQNALRMFLQILTDPAYGWGELCWDRFGEHPAQVFP
jgi:hypothetical protein